MHKGYTFEKALGVFDGFVKHLYDVKATTTSKVEKAVAKSLLNNLLGRFGLSIHKSKTELMNLDSLAVISQTKEVNSVTHIGDMLLVNYNNKVSRPICDELGVDYKESVLTNLRNNNESEKTFTDVSLAIASAVTSYARISINKAKLDILSRGGNLYYSDTDSIVTNIPLGKDVVGGGLGQFKLEHMVKRGYFISSKTYCLVLDSGRTIVKAKGVNSHKLGEEDFMRLYKGDSV